MWDLMDRLERGIEGVNLMKKGIDDARGTALIVFIVIICLLLFAFALYSLMPEIFWFM
jgi:hypothetical protein